MPHQLQFGPLTLAALLLAGLAPVSAHAQLSTTDTRLLSEPAVSATEIVFTYAGDLWTAKLDGSDVRRLTTAEGDETNPVFSPDGKWIAFSGNYDGNRDVYLVPAAGGEPRRLTWHPGPDIPQAFTPDGTRILFISGRADYSDRYAQFYTVAVEGGPETRLAIPNAVEGTYSPDGKSIAYNPIGRAFEQWKGYRGGQASEIWLIDTGTWEVEKIPQPAGRSNDVDAMWVEPNVVWFRSDRDGEFNLYRYDRRTKQLSRATNHADFPVMNASAGGGKIIYEQGGWLYLLDAVSGNTTGRRLTIGVAADLRETRPRWVKGADFVRNGSLSPTGARVAVETRGEIVTVPVEKGDARNLTNSPGVHERSPAWSPDGTQIAFVSDQGGEYKLHIAPQDGKGAHRVIDLGGAGFYFGLDWSPDGKRIAYWDNSQTIYVLDVATGKSRRVGANRIYSPLVGLSYSWSPDSKWLAYIASEQPLVRAVSMYDVENSRSTPVTDGLSEVDQPVFDKSGRYLYVLASTDAGPALDWFSQSSAGLRRTRGIYAIALSKKAPNPFAPESDEEKVAAAAADSAKKDDTKPAPTVIDFDRISQRVVAFPIAQAELLQLGAGEAGQVYYLRLTDGKGVIRRYDAAKKKDEVVIPDAESFALTDDGKKLVYRSGPAWFVTATAAPKAGEGQLNMAEVKIRIEPRAEWAQIFDEAWRIQRDYFYATN
ncbi:MAG: peptidase S41, partial [Gemmatimonadota bacterium]